MSIPPKPTMYSYLYYSTVLASFALVRPIVILLTSLFPRPFPLLEPQPNDFVYLGRLSVLSSRLSSPQIPGQGLAPQCSSLSFLLSAGPGFPCVARSLASTWPCSGPSSPRPLAVLSSVARPLVLSPGPQLLWLCAFFPLLFLDIA